MLNNKVKKKEKSFFFQVDAERNCWLVYSYLLTFVCKKRDYINILRVIFDFYNSKENQHQLIHISSRLGKNKSAASL